MNDNVWLLLATAASVAFVHTILGPDHYVPFVVFAKARRWTTAKTIAVTVACGIGHVLSSVALGMIGIAFGVGLFKLEAIEAARGTLAGWLLLAFGLVYFAWGMRRAIRHQPHTHWHAHADGIVHTHEHQHTGDHVHVHDNANAKPSLTPWILFTIFVFGPCEPLIPIVMYPAATGSIVNVVLVTLVFGITTIGTMTVIVILAVRSANRIPVGLGRFEHYGHAAAGFALVLCGVAIQLGL